MKGTIVKFDSGRRFGFIREREDSDDIFFHQADVDSGADKLAPGTTVDFEVGESNKGPKAINVRVRSRAASPYQFYLGAAAFIGVAVYAGLAMYVPALTPLGAYLCAMSAAAFVLTGFDKGIASSATMRVPEKILYGVAAVGGSLGLALGMQFFRHKTKKSSFQFMVFVIMVAQVALGKAAGITIDSILHHQARQFSRTK